MILEAGWQIRYIEFDELFKELNISELFISITLWIENFLWWFSHPFKRKNVIIFFLL